jgi:enoyl-CoA hydratase/carnithine racemase
LAGQIARQSPDAIRAAKRLYNAAWTGRAEQTLALEARLQSELIGSPNQLAAVTAGIRREPASFQDPAGSA